MGIYQSIKAQNYNNNFDKSKVNASDVPEKLWRFGVADEQAL